MEKKFNQMLEESIQKAKEAKAKFEKDPKNETLEHLLDRVVDYEGMDPYEVQQLALIYMGLAPNDYTHQISIRMVKDFLKNVVEKDNQKGLAKARRYYDFHNPLPDKQQKKLAAFTNNFWNKYRTVENCYQYSKAFHDMAEKIAPKLDAPEDMDALQRMKWFRMWAFVLRDQGFFWDDINHANKTINVKKSLLFERAAILTPEVMLIFEKAEEFLGAQDGEFILEMFQSFVNMYPEHVRNQFIAFAEFEKNECASLKASSIREDVKRKLFPTLWVSGMYYFFTKSGMKVTRADLLQEAVLAYKAGGIGTLNSFFKVGTDPYSKFKRRSYKCYEIVSKENQDRKLYVTSQEELQMHVEVYKWLCNHPEFRFGEENKTISEYGMEGLLNEKVPIAETSKEFILNMGYVDKEDDIDFKGFMSVLDADAEEVLEKYYYGKVPAKEVLEKIGFSSDLQVIICCSKKAKVRALVANKMMAALKRVKMFGENMSSKSDKIYYLIFKHILKNNPERLPNNMVNVYGNMK